MKNILGSVKICNIRFQKNGKVKWIPFLDLKQIMKNLLIKTRQWNVHIAPSYWFVTKSLYYWQIIGSKMWMYVYPFYCFPLSIRKLSQIRKKSAGFKKISTIITCVDICNEYVFALSLHICTIGLSSTVINKIIIKNIKKVI